MIDWETHLPLSNHVLLLQDRVRWQNALHYLGGKATRAALMRSAVRWCQEKFQHCTNAGPSDPMGADVDRLGYQNHPSPAWRWWYSSDSEVKPHDRHQLPGILDMRRGDPNVKGGRYVLVNRLFNNHSMELHDSDEFWCQN